MESIWSLPGPAQFAADVAARLDRGASVLVVLPAFIAADEDFRAGLRDAIDYGCDPLDDCPVGDRPMASVVADRFGIDDIVPGPDAIAALARHDRMLGRALAVTLRDKPEESARWVDFLRAFLAAARTVPVGQRPRVLVFGGHSCVGWLAGTQVLEPLWWWGVLDRLDTASLVRRELAGQDRNDLLRDTVTEVAGFDLDLAIYLAGVWDGDDRTLAAILAGFRGPDWPPAIVPRQLPHSSTRLGSPPAVMLDLWDRGLADAWDAFPVYLHACEAADDVLRSRIWRAQIRCLMPQIDEERTRIEAWIRREIPSLPDDEVLEPGALYEILQDNPYLRKRHGQRYQLVSWLRHARNRLAHLNVLSPQEIADGRRLMAGDHRHA